LGLLSWEKAFLIIVTVICMMNLCQLFYPINSWQELLLYVILFLVQRWFFPGGGESYIPEVNEKLLLGNSTVANLYRQTISTTTTTR